VGIKYNQDGKLSGAESSSTVTNIEIGPGGGSGSSTIDTPFSSNMDIRQTGTDTMTEPDTSLNTSRKSKSMGLFNPTYTKRDSTSSGSGKDQPTSSENLVMDNIELDGGPFGRDADETNTAVNINAVFSSSGEKEKSKKFLFKKSSKKKGIIHKLYF
jgi:hypothetical protein